MTEADERREIQRGLEEALMANENFVCARGDPLVEALLSMAVNAVVSARRQGRTRDWRYGSVAHFVLAHGRLAKGWRPLPTGFAYGPLNHCFKNSLDTALDRDLALVEGFVMTQGGSPLEHAWNATAQGEVVDVTLRSAAEVAAEAARRRVAAGKTISSRVVHSDAETRYFGVGLDPLYVFGLSGENYGSAIDRYDKDWPLLRDEGGVVGKVVRPW